MNLSNTIDKYTHLSAHIQIQQSAIMSAAIATFPTDETQCDTIDRIVTLPIEGTRCDTTDALVSDKGVIVKLDDVLTAIKNYNTTYLTDNAHEIGLFYEDKYAYVVSHCKMCSCKQVSYINLFDHLSRPFGETGDDYPDDHDVNWFRSFKFLIENKIIDPNKIVDGELLIASCLKIYTGWKMQYERLKFLLVHTSSEVIRNFRDDYDRTIILCMLSGNCHMSDRVFDEFHDLFVEMGVDINAIGEWHNEEDEDNEDEDDVGGDDNVRGIPIQYLYSMAWRLDVKRVKIALDAGQDPNLHIDSAYFHKRNIAQNLLERYCKTKQNSDVTAVAKIMRMLIAHGLDLSYVDTNGCNIMDYVIEYKWDNTDVMKHLRANSCPKATGNKFPVSKWKMYEPELDATSISPALKLLYENRYQKDPTKIAEILAELKRMKENGADFKAEKVCYVGGHDRGRNVYEAICQYGSWYDSDVADYLKAEVA